MTNEALEKVKNNLHREAKVAVEDRNLFRKDRLYTPEAGMNSELDRLISKLDPELESAWLQPLSPEM